MLNVFAVFVGGGLGALTRWGTTLLGTQLLEHIAMARGWQEPRSSVAAVTMVINLLGCFAIGFAFGLFERRLPVAPLRLFVMTGFLGGFTTFSTYALEFISGFRNGKGAQAIAIAAFGNVGGWSSVLLGILLGDALGRLLQGAR